MTGTGSTSAPSSARASATTMTWPAATDAFKRRARATSPAQRERRLVRDASRPRRPSRTTRDLVVRDDYAIPPARPGPCRQPQRGQGRDRPSPRRCSRTPRVSAVTYGGHVVARDLVVGGQRRQACTAPRRPARRSTFTTIGPGDRRGRPQGPTNGQAKIYVDGIYVRTIDLQRSSAQSKVVVFNTSWTSGRRSTRSRLVVDRRHRAVEVDAFVVLR